MMIDKAVKAALREEPTSDIQIEADNIRLLQILLMLIRDAKTKLLQQIVLTIMNLENPDQTEKVSTQANIPLLGFETPNEVLSYLDAVIRSGTSTEHKSGTVFLMGNTAHCLLN